MSYPTFKQVLKHVRQWMINRSNPSRFICINIEYVLEEVYKIRNSVLVKRYQGIIEKELQRGASPEVEINSYNEWIKINHPIAYRMMNYDNYREGRIQWIDYMLTRKDL